METLSMNADPGVWGVPYVVIGAEAFFGADRLPHIARHLRG